MRTFLSCAAFAHCAAVALIATGAAPAFAQEARPDPKLVAQASAVPPALLYRGWRARERLGQPVFSKGRKIGALRNLILDKNGALTAAIIEGGGVAGVPDALFRIPWNRLTPRRGEKGSGEEGFSVDLSSGERPQYALFPGTPGVPQSPREFRISEVIGDDVYLQTGRGYGAVSDAVFTPEGRVMAVLVSRDELSGGGTFAFPFTGYSGAWDPGLSYLGLPYVTQERAAEAALRVEPDRFASATPQQ